MNIKELGEYCKLIEIDCDKCKHKTECKILEEKLEEISAYGLIELIEKNSELN